MIKQFFDRQGEKRRIRNEEKINVQILAKRFFDGQVKKRRLSGAKPSIFNEVDRKTSKVKTDSYF